MNKKTLIILLAILLVLPLASANVIFNSESGSITFNTSSTEKVRITNEGLVGISTTSPLSILDVAQGATTSTNINHNDTPNNYAGLAWNGTLLNVTSVSGFPTAGTLIIESEAITYSAVDTTLNTFTNLTRGVLGTTAANHTNNTAVYYLTTTVTKNATLAPHMVIRSDGNIGIGNATPSQKLHVEGDVNVTGDVSAANFFGDGSSLSGVSLSNVSLNYAYNGSAWLGAKATTMGVLQLDVTSQSVDEAVGSFRIAKDLTVDTNTLYVDSTNDKVGIGTLTPGAQLTVIGEINGSGLNISGGGYFGGKVGIGIITPLDKLHIADGLLRISGNRSDGLSLNVSDVLYVNASSGNVGIGTSSPTSKLHVIGDLNVSGTSYLGDVVISADNITVTDIVSKNGGIKFLNKTRNETMRIDTMGRVGIGTKSPTSKLHVDGNANVTGNVSADYFFGDGTQLSGVALSNVSLNYAYNGSDWLGARATNIGVLKFDITSQSADTALTSFTVGENFTVDTNTLFVDSTANRVGIGTLTPSSTLHVAGDLNVTGTSYLGSMTFEGGNITATLGTFTTLNVTGTSYLGSMVFEAGNITATLGTFTNLNVTGTAYLGDTTIESDNITVNNIKSRDGNLSFFNDSDNELMRITSDGYVGIGTITPTSTLHVIGSLNVSGASYLGTFTIQDDLIVGNINISGTSNKVGIGTTSPNAELTVIGEINATGLNISGVGYFGGNVGIGTSSPGAELTVVGEINGSGLNISGGAYIGGNTLIDADLNVTGTSYLGSMVFKSGNITATRATFTTLNVTGTSYLGDAEISADKISVDNLTTTATGKNLTFYTDGSERVRITMDGDVGIGTPTPQQKLTLSSGSNFSTEMTTPTGASGTYVNVTGASLAAATYYYKVTALDGAGGETAASSEVSVTTNGNGNASQISWTAVTGVSSYRVYNASSSDGQATYFTTTDTAFNHSGQAVDGDASPPSFTNAYVSKVSALGSSWFLGGNVGIGIAIPGQKLHVSGSANITNDLYVGGNITSYGSDFAEMFDSKEALEPNDVVCLDNNKKIEKCSKRAQKSVIGVVSESPTIIGNSGKGKYPVGIVGIVKTKVKAPVNRFDLLTTSNEKGFAETASYLDFGAIIGKAMESCDIEECKIDVMVTLS